MLPWTIARETATCTTGTSPTLPNGELTFSSA